MKIPIGPPPGHPCYMNLDASVYVATMHTLGAMTTIINGFCAFIILKYSPPYFGWYKWCMLLYHTSCSTLDWALTIGTIPVTFVPYPVGYPRGILYLFWTTWHQTAFVFVCGFFTVSSMVMMFLYRAYTVMPVWHVLHVKKTTFVCICILIYSTAFVPYKLVDFATRYNATEETENWAKTEQPCRSYLAEFDGFLVINFKNGRIMGQILICVYLLFLSLFVIASCITLSMSVLGCTKGISPQTRKLQKKLMMALMAQTTVPCVLVMIPFFLGFYLCYYIIPNTQIFGDIIFYMLSSHGMSSAISILVFNAPYFKVCKEALLSISRIIWKKRMENKAAIGAVAPCNDSSTNVTSTAPIAS